MNKHHTPQSKKVPLVSKVLEDGTVIEMVYLKKEQRTQFAIGNKKKWNIQDTAMMQGNQEAKPWSPHNTIIRNDVVLFPTKPQEYESDAELYEGIRAYIHRYVDLTPSFERIAAAYVVLTWVYEDYPDIPYLRFRGDFGTGKSRALKTIGRICNRPMFGNGAGSVSSIFRLLEFFRGTLIYDEGDQRWSDEKSELAKVFNSGISKSSPVLRAAKEVQDGEWNPKPYNVFGPKIVATRGHYQDRALESRCLTEEMRDKSMRADIPISLPEDKQLAEAQTLRNKLLLYRLRNLGTKEPMNLLQHEPIAPRIKQMIEPLMSVTDDELLRTDLRVMARERHQDMQAARSLDVEAQVLECIRFVYERDRGSNIAIRDITEKFIEKHGEAYDGKVTNQWVGKMIRQKLQLRTMKSNGIYVIPLEEIPRLNKLYEKFSVDSNFLEDNNDVIVVPLDDNENTKM